MSSKAEPRRPREGRENRQATGLPIRAVIPALGSVVQGLGGLVAALKQPILVPKMFLEGPDTAQSIPRGRYAEKVQELFLGGEFLVREAPFQVACDAQERRGENLFLSLWVVHIEYLPVSF